MPGGPAESGETPPPEDGSLADDGFPIDPETVLADDGSVDFDRLYREGGLAAAPITAEQAARIFASIPGDLPLWMRRRAAQASLNILNHSGTEASASIVPDATAKAHLVTRLYDRLDALRDARTLRINQEILTLQNEIAMRRAQLADSARQIDAAQHSCLERTEELYNVLLFFGIEGAADGAVGHGPNAMHPALPPGEERIARPADREDLPAFLQVGTVLRMLGLSAMEPTGRSSPSDPRPDETGK
jgi:hypothetical protein